MVLWLTELLKRKSPLRGTRGGSTVFYWFRQDPEITGEVTSDGVLIDEDCQLPIELFHCLSVEAQINEMCCMYFSKEEAFEALELALKRFKPVLEKLEKKV